MKHAELNRAHREAVDTPWSDRRAPRNSFASQWREPDRRARHLDADDFDPLLVKAGRAIGRRGWYLAVALAVALAVTTLGYMIGRFAYDQIAWFWM